MAKSAVSLTPTLSDFETLLAESYLDHPATEGSVVKGKVVSIENDFAVSGGICAKHPKRQLLKSQRVKAHAPFWHA